MTWFQRNKSKIIICSLAFPPLLVSVISTIHVVTFFQLTNYFWLAFVLAIAFEVGTLSSLAALTIVKHISEYSLWAIFILLTGMQIMGNIYFSYNYVSEMVKVNPDFIRNWNELFDMTNEKIEYTKRLLSIISGGVLPIVSLAFTHLLVGYVNKIDEIKDTKLFNNDIIITPEDKKEIDKILAEPDGEKYIEYTK